MIFEKGRKMTTAEKTRKLTEILEEKGQGFNFKYGDDGSIDHDVITEREDLGYEASPRATKLLDEYYQALASTTTEWQYNFTRKWEELEGELTILRRAKAQAYAFSHLEPAIYPGELIVGGKTNYLRGSFGNPWLIQSFFVSKSSELYDKYKSDSNARNAMDKVAQIGTGGGNVTHDLPGVISLAGKFGLRAEEVPALNKITDYWSGKTLEEIGESISANVPGFDIKNNLLRTATSRADSAYTIPVGRQVVTYYYPLQYGLDGMIDYCNKRYLEVSGKADGDGYGGIDRMYFYQAVTIIIGGIQNWIGNYVKELERRIPITANARQKVEYEEIRDALSWIQHKPPRTFREAVQICWFTQLALVNEEVASGMSPGRLGQVLYPWYDQDIKAGRTTDEEVMEILELMRVKFTAIDLFVSTASSSVLMGNTFNNVALGGLDRAGKPANNKLDWMLLEAAERVPTTQPTLSVLWDEKLPEDFLLKAAEVVKLGNGFPAYMNCRVSQEFLLDHFAHEGMNPEEARAFAIGGCLETNPGTWKTVTVNGQDYEIPCGACGATVNGVHFISNPSVINLVLFNGKDMRTGIQLLPPHDKKLETYEEFWQQYKEYYELIVGVQLKFANIQHDLHRKYMPTLWNSATTPGCLEKGHDLEHMGAKYNSAEFAVESTGTVNMVNSLASLKKLVYEDKKYSLDEMKDAIANNFGFYLASEIKNYSMSEQIQKPDGGKYDEILSDCLSAPKYGVSDPYADAILQEYEHWFCKFPKTLRSFMDEPLYPCQISVSTHGVFGNNEVATPDGRLAGVTFADASMSAAPGTDRKGPYALFESACCWDHSQSQNSQMNLKIHPTVLKGDAGTKHLADLVRGYMTRGGFHIQFNVVDSKMLQKAQKEPENYRDLMVRVAGFTQYWVEISKPIQDELIARTEYEGV